MTKLHEPMFAILVIGQVISCLVVSSATLLETKSDDSDPCFPLNLEYLGTANQASYFVDNSQHMSRSEAAAFCQAARLNLATIETRAQVDMISRSLNGMGYAGKWYWTSGRESLKDTTFVWNGTLVHPSSSIVTTWVMYDDEHYCLLFTTESPDVTLFYAKSCAPTFSAYPLCQT